MEELSNSKGIGNENEDCKVDGGNSRTGVAVVAETKKASVFKYCNSKYTKAQKKTARGRS
jgi:hypothetical protein